MKPIKLTNNELERRILKDVFSASEHLDDYVGEGGVPVTKVVLYIDTELWDELKP